MAGVNKKGRSKKSPRYAALPHRVLNSWAYGSLDLTARALLVELVMIENGSNNGSLWLSVRDAADRLGLASHHPVVRAFSDLVDRKLVELTVPGSFVKASEASRARCWRMSWLPWKEGPSRKRAPNWEFEKYQLPSGSDCKVRRVRKRAMQRDSAMKRWQKAKSENRLPVVDFTAMPPEIEARRLSTDVNFTASKPKKRRKPPFPIVENFTAHTDVTRGSAFTGWWLSDVEADLTAKMLLVTHITQNRLQVAQAA